MLLRSVYQTHSVCIVNITNVNSEQFSISSTKLLFLLARNADSLECLFFFRVDLWRGGGGGVFVVRFLCTSF